jgi:putative glycosyltransferase (TIGR04348 family)
MSLPRVLIITPPGAASRTGNRATAIRWRAQLMALGCRVRIADGFIGRCPDLTIALHARRSAAAVREASTKCATPIVVMLTGTDIYKDLPADRDAHEALQRADRIVALQPDMATRVPTEMRHKVRTIVQAASVSPIVRPVRHKLDVLVSGHLRDEKDPFMAVQALATLPGLPIRLSHIGDELTPGFREHALDWMQREPRYRYYGGWSPARARRRLASADLLINASRIEGCPAVVCEALSAGTPVLASRIPAHEGLLGVDYPGLFPVADSAALATLLRRVTEQADFLRQLRVAMQARRSVVSPLTEQTAIAALLRELEVIRS